MINLDLHYHIQYGLVLRAPSCVCARSLACSFAFRWMGDMKSSEAQLKMRLDAGLPTLFYLWTPHRFVAVHRLHRIQLPMYTTKGFGEGKTDYPSEVLEKVASSQLASVAPRVKQLVARFQLENSAQESMIARTAEGRSVFQASCEWLKSPDNERVWSRWMPAEGPQDSNALTLALSMTWGLACPKFADH